jgi:translation elongation factor EF-1alpha
MCCVIYILQECVITDLISIQDKKTGKPIRRPRFAKEGSVVTAKVKLGRSISIEKYEVR